MDTGKAKTMQEYYAVIERREKEDELNKTKDYTFK